SRGRLSPHEYGRLCSRPFSVFFLVLLLGLRWSGYYCGRQHRGVVVERIHKEQTPRDDRSRSIGLQCAQARGVDEQRAVARSHVERRTAQRIADQGIVLQLEASGVAV